MVTLLLESAAAMEALGAHLAGVIPAGCILYLRGELGTGKTTLVRGFLRALGYGGVVRSPTYTLMEPYTLGDKEIIHLDLYRLAEPEELEFLGLRDWLDGHAILLIEWPERGDGLLPPADIEIAIEHAATTRLCRLKAVSATGEAVLVRLKVCLADSGVGL
jgi:tRNA threonylcarbamoyladenosine biosynthesis protein TsaE